MYVRFSLVVEIRVKNFPITFRNSEVSQLQQQVVMQVRNVNTRDFDLLKTSILSVDQSYNACWQSFDVYTCDLLQCCFHRMTRVREIYEPKARYSAWMKLCLLFFVGSMFFYFITYTVGGKTIEVVKNLWFIFNRNIRFEVFWAQRSGLKIMSVYMCMFLLVVFLLLLASLAFFSWRVLFFGLNSRAKNHWTNFVKL